jgi:hypothetical protein
MQNVDIIGWLLFVGSQGWPGRIHASHSVKAVSCCSKHIKYAGTSLLSMYISENIFGVLLV